MVTLIVIRVSDSVNPHRAAHLDATAPAFVDVDSSSSDSVVGVGNEQVSADGNLLDDHDSEEKFFELDVTRADLSEEKQPEVRVTSTKGVGPDIDRCFGYPDVMELPLTDLEKQFHNHCPNFDWDKYLDEDYWVKWKLVKHFRNDLDDEFHPFSEDWFGWVGYDARHRMSHRAGTDVFKLVKSEMKRFGINYKIPNNYKTFATYVTSVLDVPSGLFFCSI